MTLSIHLRGPITLKIFYPKKDILYEDDELPNNEELIILFEKSLNRLKSKANEISFSEKNLSLYFDLNNDQFFRIDMDNFDNQIINYIDKDSNYMRFKLDPKLLKRALMGPKYANWNNIEIGAHLDFERKPDIQNECPYIIELDAYLIAFYYINFY